MQKKWNYYKKTVYTQPLHPVQEKETKQAFYSGALEGLNYLIESMEKGSGEKQLQADLNSLYKELSNELKTNLG